MNLNATVFFQILVFFVLSLFTMKFVWPPIVKAIDDRRRKIADGLADAEQGKSDLVKAKKEIALMQEQVKLDIKNRYTEAEKRISLIMEQAKLDADCEKSKLLDIAHKEIEQIMINNRNLLRDDLAKLVMLGVEQILKKEIDINVHNNLISQLKSQL